MLRINDFKECKAYVFHNDVYIGIIYTQYQLNDIRLQVKEGQLKGVYLTYYDTEHVFHQINIDSSGSLSNWPNGFFDVVEKQLFQLAFENDTNNENVMTNSFSEGE